MITLSEDTDPKIEKIQLEFLRTLQPYRKFQMVCQMNSMVYTFMLAGVKQRHPDATPDVLHKIMADLILGKELAQKVWSYHVE